jgi:hypothetical protein
VRENPRDNKGGNRDDSYDRDRRGGNAKGSDRDKDKGSLERDREKWVPREDYEELQQELERLRAENEELVAQLQLQEDIIEVAISLYFLID